MWGDCRVTSELFEYKTNLGARADWATWALANKICKKQWEEGADAQS